jgi:hypothetical protein
MVLMICDIQEAYCKQVMYVRHRVAMTRFRTGTAPITIETGRDEALPISQRKCIMCDHIEGEIHV